MKNTILSYLSAACPWRDTLHWYDTVDSTNIRARELAQNGAPHGTIVLAAAQTAGRGRMGRSFSSPKNMGVYLSLILRPGCTPDKLMHLTCAAGLAARQAVKQVCGIAPGIKWANDLVWEGKKLGGILTQLSLDGSLVDYAIVGIGINCCQAPEDFPQDIRGIATSLQQLTGSPCSPAQLSAALTEQLWQTDKTLLTEKTQLMDTYRQCCITLGQEISLVQGDSVTHGTALDIDPDGALVVRLTDGSIQTVSFGEVSIRGMYGYV